MIGDILSRTYGGLKKDYFVKKSVKHPKSPYLTFPWTKGMTAENMEK